MNNSIQEGTTVPDSYAHGIEHYAAYALNDLHKRFDQAGEITRDYYILIRHLKLLDPVAISLYSPLTFLLTGDTDGSRALFMRTLQSMECLLYTSPSPRDLSTCRMHTSA